jgi:predicted molibdopterin-dependent oxidoreductase YjgC
MADYITRHPILKFEHGKMVKFTFEDRELEGFENEPIAAALHAAGVRVLSYSEKHKRPRGFFCAVGKCSSCLMEVDGRKNVMVCMEPLRAGMKVRRQQGRHE